MRRSLAIGLQSLTRSPPPRLIAVDVQERKQWPRDLVGAQSRPGSMQIDAKLRDAILDAELVAMPSHAEPLSGDGFRLEFYDDGYPKLPECLRRRARYAP